jgi:hypothetical protein
MAFTDEEAAFLLKQGLTPEQVLEAEKLDADKGAMKGYVDELGLDTAARSVMDVAGGIKDAGVKFLTPPPGVDIGSPINAARTIGETLFGGVKTPLEAVDRVGGTAASMIPGVGRTGYGMLKDYALEGMQIPGAPEGVAYEPKSRQEYGGQLARNNIDDLVGLGIGAGVAGAVSGVGRLKGNWQARSAARTAAINDPASQAAVRLARAQGLMDSPTARDSIAAGRLTDPIVTEGADIAVNKVKGYGPKTSLQGVVTDDLLADSLGAPGNNSGTTSVAARQLSEAGPSVFNTGIYHTDTKAQFDPFTGKFEGFDGNFSVAPKARPAELADVIDKAEVASAQIAAARQQTVTALDKAQQLWNQNPPGGAQRIAGLTFEKDVKPLIGELETLIDKRAKHPASQSMAEGMQKAITDMRTAMLRLKTSTEAHLKAGEIGVSDALAIIEDSNAVRRSIGQFDRRAQANGLTGNHNDFAGRAAELYGLGEVQAALQSALEAKAIEITKAAPALMTQAPEVSSFLSQVGEKSLATMNEKYGAFQTLAEAGTERLGVIARQKLQANSNSLVGTEQTRNNLLENPRGNAFSVVANKIDDKLGVSRKFSPVRTDNEQLRQRKALRMPDEAITQVLDGLLLRERPVPILSRDFEKVRMSADSMAELNNRAVKMGLLASGVFFTLSEPMQKEVHKQVALMAPQAMETVPGGFNVVSQEFMDANEKEAHIKDVQDLSLEHQARIVPASWQNKFVPRPDRASMPGVKTMRPIPNLQQLNADMAPALDTPVPNQDSSYDGGTMGMLEELTRARDTNARSR